MAGVRWLPRLENFDDILSLFYSRVYEADESRQRLFGLISSSLEAVRTLKIQFGLLTLRTLQVEEQVNRDILYPSRLPLLHTSEIGRHNLQRIANQSGLRFLHEDVGLRRTT